MGKISKSGDPSLPVGPPAKPANQPASQPAPAAAPLTGTPPTPPPAPPQHTAHWTNHPDMKELLAGLFRYCGDCGADHSSAVITVCRHNKNKTDEVEDGAAYTAAYVFP